MHVKINAFFSRSAANVDFRLPKVMQQHPQGMIRNITSFYSKFYTLSGSEKILKIGYGLTKL